MTWMMGLVKDIGELLHWETDDGGKIAANTGHYCYGLGVLDGIGTGPGEGTGQGYMLA